MKHCIAFCVIILCAVVASEQLWQQADKKLSQGMYKEAIDLYTQHLESDASNFRILFKRAEAKYFFKDLAGAQTDLNQIIARQDTNEASVSLKTQAMFLRGKINLALGDFASSISDFETILKQLKADHKDSLLQLQNAQRAQRQVKQVKDAPTNYEQCVAVLGSVISSTCLESVDLRLMRAQCAIKLKHHSIAQEEAKRILMRDKRNAEATVIYAQSMYRLGAVDLATRYLKDYLKTDPDNRAVQQLVKTIRKNESLFQDANTKFQSRNFATAAQLFEQYIGNFEDQDPYNFVDATSKICAAHKELKNKDSCVTWCTKTIDQFQSSNPEQGGADQVLVDALLNRAECYIQHDDFDKAKRDIDTAQQRDPQSRRVFELSQRIQKLQRMAARKDHYKTLGVSRNASLDEIKRAFKKLVMQNHPDREPSDKPEAKQAAEKRYRDIIEAHEVLKDEEKRRRYDNGDDDDQQQGSQFHQGFPGHFFNGGQTFTFNFGF